MDMQLPNSTADFAEVRPWEGLPAEQQPDWRGHDAYAEVCQRLASAPPLVTAAEVRGLRRALAKLVTGEATLLQGGDCAESFYECGPAHVAEKLGIIDRLGDRLNDLTGMSVIRVGRMGGQFAKPRSQSVERCGERHIPSFRGHMINSEIPSTRSRTPDPRRMWWAYEASDKVQRVMRRHRRGHSRLPATVEGPWSSHEALVIDYETCLVRPDPETGELYLTSTHLPWVGERTRDPAHAQVGLLASVANPVGCKIGPTASGADVVSLCESLNPRREPGRLLLIPRMGSTLIREVLPGIVRSVVNAGHPVIWLCDPMHGNTVVSRQTGLKTRYTADVIAEALRFRDIVEGHGQYAAGLHIEVAAGDVTECVGGSVRSEDDLQRHYSSLCDPRLNADQATELLEAWVKGASTRPL
nr:2-keto-3-deoxy-D-arabino-heptulosonate-7-phosphate synthase II [Kibdelosporangium sp. MJ126-NF4]